MELIPIKLTKELEQKIKDNYISEDGFNIVLDSITQFKNYSYILFADHDFLPYSLERLVTLYLGNPPLYEEIFGDVDLADYRILMPKDLQEKYDKTKNKTACKKNRLLELPLLNSILLCCERVQASRLHINKSEDDINDQLRDLLTVRGYSLRDQTRQGLSSKGKQAGEIDILIKNSDFPHAIVEALKLTSLNKAYISSHIDKIYKYDTTGCDVNFIISYVRIKDFGGFWNRYTKFAKTYEYPHKLQQYIENPVKQFSELKCSVAILKRNNSTTKLYHIAVHLS